MDDVSASAARHISVKGGDIPAARAKRGPVAPTVATPAQTAPIPANAGRLNAGAKSFISACAQSRLNTVAVQSRGAVHGGSHIPVQVLSAPRLLTLGSRTTLRLKAHQIDGLNWL